MAIALEVDPGLCEEVVLGHVLSEERAGRVPEWRRESEAIYRLPDARERDRSFRDLALRTFATLPAAATIRALLAEFEPRFHGVARAVFQRANRPSQEGAELHIAGSDRIVRTEVSVTRMLSQEGLADLVRSEWTHVADMLDPGFGYVPEELEQAGTTPFERRLIRERYRALWTTSVTGRLAREGKAPEGAEERRREEVHRAHLKLPEAAREACFRALWEGERPSHAELLALASSPAAVLERFGDGTCVELGHERMPGEPCPLCRFPAWKWGDPVAMPERTRGAVRGDFPAWTPEEGLCDRCEELYRARTGCW